MAPRGAVSVTDLDDEALAGLVRSVGGKPFQARQVAHWLYEHGADDWAGCRNLPGPLRQRLAEQMPLRASSLARAETAADGTTKLLLALHDGETVETVVIPESDRTTLCISTQVGCPVACVFCASGLDGVRRNLRVGEIVEQVLHGIAHLEEGRTLTNLVVMGLGEPMLNLENLLAALERIHDPEGLGLGARRITVSTSGHPDRIARFARAPHAYNLAISLHAAEPELRAELVPNSRATPAELRDAARLYLGTKGREVTFEVVLLAGVNDRARDAEALIELLGGIRATVNLIPWNPVEEITHLRRPTPAAVDAFAESLRVGGLNVTVRRQRGADRNAACGQLRLRDLHRA